MATLKTIRITVFYNVVLCNLVGQVPICLSKISNYLPLNLNIFIDLVLSEVPQPSKIIYNIAFFFSRKGVVSSKLIPKSQDYTLWTICWVHKRWGISQERYSLMQFQVTQFQT